MSFIRGHRICVKSYDHFSGSGDKPAVSDKVVNGDNSGDEDVKEEEEDEDNFEYYNKTKSFFDSISCEALEREKGLGQYFIFDCSTRLLTEIFF